MSTPTPETWATIDLVLRGAWPAGNDPYGQAQQAAYRLVLGDYPEEVTARAVKSIGKRGGAFRPSASEIADECERLLGRDLLPMAFSLDVCERAAWTGQGMATGAAMVREAMGPVTEAWFRAQGRSMIRASELGESKYAAMNRERVIQSWEGFARGHKIAVRGGKDPMDVLTLPSIAPALASGEAA